MKRKKEFMYYIVIIFLGLSVVGWYCKGKENKATTDIWKRDSTKTKWTNANDATRDGFIIDTATTYVFEGKVDPDTPRTPHTTPLDWTKWRKKMNDIFEEDYKRDTTKIAVLIKKGKLEYYEYIDLLGALYKSNNWRLNKQIDSLELEIKKLKKQ